MKHVLKKIIITILTIESKVVLWLKKPTIIAITGSVGKTSTKDAVFTLLKPHVSTGKTYKSYNSDVGIPLSILGLPNAWGNMLGWGKNILYGVACFFSQSYPKYLVLEVGADHPGDISKPAQWLKPKYSIFTCFPDVPVHVEFFDSPEAVIKEKETLAQYTQKQGVLILNHDDRRVMSMKGRFSQKILSYGISKEAMLSLSLFSVKKEGTLFVATGTLIYNNETQYIHIPNLISHTQILSALPGVLILLEEGFSFADALVGLRNLKPTKGRLSVLEGINESTLIDDTYNASPIAMTHALEVLVQMPEASRRIAVLGDMMELGLYTEREHRKIGQYLSALHLDMVVCVGSRAKFIYEEIQKTSTQNIRWFDTSEKAGLFLKEHIQKNDCVLFKGSQSVRVEKAIVYCLADHLKPETVLVRQETEWLQR